MAIVSTMVHTVLLARIISLQYMKVDNIVAGTMQFGRCSLMAKFDVQNAYRIVPVHLKNRRLLGMKWHGDFYVDMVLPFGIRSAPYIFTCTADLVEWIAKENYDVNFLMHYLDDFYTLGPPGSSICQHNLDKSIDYFSKLAIPLHPNKLEGMSMCMTVPGIELDSINLQAHLPKDKFDGTTALLEEGSHKCFCKWKGLESNRTRSTPMQGRTPWSLSWRCMINLLCAFCRDDHPTIINNNNNNEKDVYSVSDTGDSEKYQSQVPPRLKSAKAPTHDK